MMRLYMSSSTFKTGEFAILVTIISKGCNGYGAVCGYYKFCFLRDFPTVTKSPPLPQLHSSTHPLMHKHTCILTHTLPIYSMWCTNTHASKHTEPISAYICKYTHTHTHISKLRETRKYDGLVPGRSIERNQGQHHPPSGSLFGQVSTILKSLAPQISLCTNMCNWPGNMDFQVEEKLQYI